VDLVGFCTKQRWAQEEAKEVERSVEEPIEEVQEKLNARTYRGARTRCRTLSQKPIVEALSQLLKPEPLK